MPISSTPCSLKRLRLSRSAHSSPVQVLENASGRRPAPPVACRGSRSTGSVRRTGWRGRNREPGCRSPKPRASILRRGSPDVRRYGRAGRARTRLGWPNTIGEQQKKGHNRDGERPGPVLGEQHRSGPGGDRRMAGVPRLPRRRQGQGSRTRRHAEPAQAVQGAAPRRADGPDDGLHQHDRARERAGVPRRRGPRAPLPRLAPLERRDHRPPRPAPRHRRRRTHLDLRLLRRPLRGRPQLVLPRQGPPRRRRPDLLPGPCLPRHVRPRLPRGPPRRAGPRRVPPGEAPRPARAELLPAPAAHARVLGVPDGLDGPRPDQRHLPGADQPLPHQPRHQGRVRPAGLGVPRRRRDG